MTTATITGGVSGAARNPEPIPPRIAGRTPLRARRDQCGRLLGVGIGCALVIARVNRQVFLQIGRAHV